MQLSISNTAVSAVTVALTFTSAGVASTLTVVVPANGDVVLPYGGAPWLIADVNTAIQFNNANTITVSAYYLND